MFVIIPKHRHTPSESSGKDLSRRFGNHALKTASAIPDGSPQAPASRVSSACDACRNRKVKCNGGMPCARCKRAESVCTYSHLQQKRKGDHTPVRIIIHLLQNLSDTHRIGLSTVCTCSIIFSSPCPFSVCAYRGSHSMSCVCYSSKSASIPH